MNLCDALMTFFYSDAWTGAAACRDEADRKAAR